MLFQFNLNILMRKLIYFLIQSIIVYEFFETLKIVLQKKSP